LIINSELPEFRLTCIVGVVGDLDTRASKTLERVGTALSDPTRRRILLVLLDGPAYPADLAEQLGVGRTNVSNHLTCLRGCGLVRATREGRQVRYDLASPRLVHALADLVDLELEIDDAHEDLDGRA
jgi:DNA-binding transcriptional ArsR family regulator